MVVVHIVEAYVQRRKTTILYIEGDTHKNRHAGFMWQRVVLYKYRARQTLQSQCMYGAFANLGLTNEPTKKTNIG